MSKKYKAIWVEEDTHARFTDLQRKRIVEGGGKVVSANKVLKELLSK